MSARKSPEKSEPDAGTAADLTYEQARSELAGVVERLEAGGATLEESLALWERGERLAEICQHRLDGARARLDASQTAGSDGN
jgi:exodeoxyribonuclease VII small subunit